MWISYLTIFILSISISIAATLVMRRLALKFNIIDRPNLSRKIHKIATPLLGGTAVFLSFFIVLYFIRDRLTAGNLETHHWLGVFIGACFLIIGGFLDDKYNLKTSRQIIWPILAGLAVIAGGVSIEKITNPLGGFIYLDSLQLPILAFSGKAYFLEVISGLFIFIWLMGMMYTTKLLDGVDGLVAGTTVIGGIIIFLFTMTTRYYQPDIGIAALVLAGACLGFLIFNWHPAKIFLGEGGSLLLGYILGVLAIISGGKIAIALLVMGIPILDVVWTIIRRILAGKNPFKFSDRKHLHFRFLNLGLSQKQTVLIYYFLSGAFGLSALFFQSRGKAFALFILFAIMLFIVIVFTYLDKKRNLV